MAKFLSEEETPDKQNVLPFNERSIFPVLSADKFLSSSYRKKFLNEIRQLTNVPDQHYEALYQQLINNFTNLVQILPTNNEARLCSLLDEGLLRGLYVLQLQSAEKKTETDPLMTYVLFSAAVLFDIGHSLEERMVLISKKQGDFIRNWYPYKGQLPENGYYKIRRGGGFPPWVCRRITPLLARQVLPEVGFSWIAQDAHALNVWLSLLFNDKDGAGALSLIFNDVIELLQKFKTTQEYFQKLDIESIEPKENKLGEDFLDWLKRGIDDGSISINKPDSTLQIVDDGILIDLALLINKYAELHQVGSVDVEKELERLGILEYSAEVKYKYTSVKTGGFAPHGREPLSQTTIAAALFGFQLSKPLQELPTETQKNVFEGQPTSEIVRGTFLGAMPATFLYNISAQIILGQTHATQEAINNNIQITQMPENLPQQIQRSLPPLAIQAPTQTQTLGSERRYF